MPHSKQVAKEFNVTKWLEEAIDHIESTKIIRRKDYGPMLKRALHMQTGGGKQALYSTIREPNVTRKICNY